jgi:uncharacterized protein YdeI (YjbR/CyaY-like superfamily)
MISRAMKVVYFPSSAAFRQWLAASHASCQELWVGLYKKSSGKPGISYPDCVDEALCVGWIDGVRRRIDQDAYTVRFTPRQTKSQWSSVNIKRVQRLSAEGRMQPAGLRAFEAATGQERKYSFEQQRESRLTPAHERQFRAQRKAWDYFEHQSLWYRRTATFWVVSAKKEDTRQKRLATLIADSESHRPIKQLTRPVPKREKKQR